MVLTHYPSLFFIKIKKKSQCLQLFLKKLFFQNVKFNFLGEEFYNFLSKMFIFNFSWIQHKSDWVSDLCSEEIGEMSIFCMLLIHSTITAIFKFQFYISHSWLTFCVWLLDATLPTELVIRYFQSINEIYQVIMDNGIS